MSEPVGEFFFHIVSSFPLLHVNMDEGVRAASTLLAQGKVTVIHFYSSG
jgi:hypothetical protein